VDGRLVAHGEGGGGDDDGDEEKEEEAGDGHDGRPANAGLGCTPSSMEGYSCMAEVGGTPR
jgi:hypothetical protein